MQSRLRIKSMGRLLRLKFMGRPARVNLQSWQEQQILVASLLVVVVRSSLAYLTSSSSFSLFSFSAASFSLTILSLSFVMISSTSNSISRAWFLATKKPELNMSFTALAEV